MYLWIDIDCYECQVWSLLYPELQNGPLIVTNGNDFKEIMISCDYEAKSYGINKNDSVESAKAKCPLLKVFRKTNTSDEPEELKRTRDRIELSIKTFIENELSSPVKFYWEGNEEGYLDVGNEVDLQMSNGFKVFEDNSWKTNAKWIFGDGEKEAKSQYVLKRMEVGVNLLAEILKRIELDTGLYGSGSVGTTKTIARLSCQLHKPRGITVVTPNGLEQLFSLVKIVDAQGLKGKNGKKILNIWKKPDGSSLETLKDFKEHVPLAELKAKGLLKSNKLLYALMSHWENMDGSKKSRDKNIRPIKN